MHSVCMLTYLPISWWLTYILDLYVLYRKAGRELPRPLCVCKITCVGVYVVCAPQVVGPQEFHHLEIGVNFEHEAVPVGSPPAPTTKGSI